MSSGGLTCPRYVQCLLLIIPFVLYACHQYLLCLVGGGDLNEIAKWA